MNEEYDGKLYKKIEEQTYALTLADTHEHTSASICL